MPSAISQPSNTVHTASSTSPVRSEPTELPSTFCVLMLRMRIGVRAVVKGDADDQYGDKNHQARVLQVARLEVEPRLGVVVHISDRNNHGFDFLEIR